MKIKKIDFEKADSFPLHSGNYEQENVLTLQDILRLEEPLPFEEGEMVFTANKPHYPKPQNMQFPKYTLVVTNIAKKQERDSAKKRSAPSLDIGLVPHEEHAGFLEYVLPTDNIETHNQLQAHFVKELLLDTSLYTSFGPLQPRGTPITKHFPQTNEQRKGDQQYTRLMQKLSNEGVNQIHVRFETCETLQEYHTTLSEMVALTGMSKLYKENDSLVIDFTRKLETGILLVREGE